MNRSILAALFALSLVLAGCNGLALGGDETPERTFTPAPVPTDEPTPTPVPQLAPGLMGTGVTDAFALRLAHSSVLDNTSYTFYSNTTVRHANGTVFNRIAIRVQSTANHSRYFFTQNGSPVAISGWRGFSLWFAGERVLVTQTNESDTSYSIPRSADGEPVPLHELSFFSTNSAGVGTLFSSVETRVANRKQRNGTTVYRVVATNVTNPAAFERRWQNPRNLTLVAFVDSRGLVRAYRLDYTATLSNSTVRISRQVRYTNIGTTTVERPPWYEQAIENVSTATPTVD